MCVECVEAQHKNTTRIDDHRRVDGGLSCGTLRLSNISFMYSYSSNAGDEGVRRRTEGGGGGGGGGGVGSGGGGPAAGAGGGDDNDDVDVAV